MVSLFVCNLITLVLTIHFWYVKKIICFIYQRPSRICLLVLVEPSESDYGAAQRAEQSVEDDYGGRLQGFMA